MNTQTKNFKLRGLVIIIVMAALVFAGIRVTGAAAQAAIPGDALYSVKTTIEQTRLSLASDAGDRAQMKMAFAEQRLNEISALIEEGRYHEINLAVLSFEADINGAILELETLAGVDPARSARLALEITSALTRYAQTLSLLATSAPDAVRNEVNRALTSTHTASGLDLPDGNLNANDNDNANSNSNENVNSNDNGDDNSNANDSMDDNSNTNTSMDDNANDNGDDNGNANTNSSNDDNSNTNTSMDDNTNDNGDDNGNANTNSSIDDNSNANTGIDDNSNTNTSMDDNTNGNGDDNTNTSIDDNANANDNGDDKGGSSGKGGGG